jgi:hypothetical protein
MTMTEFQCTTCGGNNVLCDAWVGLNDPEDVRIFDQAFCEDCDGECDVEEVEVTDEDEDDLSPQPEYQSQAVTDERNCMSFGMFTEQGNRLVAQIVKNAIAKELDWPEVHAQLHELAKHDAYGEATDTAVREVVWWAIGAARRGEQFYV